jgi:choline kinase
MKAIIVAAGMGRRLAPYTDDRPKTLVEVNGRSIL